MRWLSQCALPLFGGLTYLVGRVYGKPVVRKGDCGFAKSLHFCVVVGSVTSQWLRIYQLVQVTGLLARLLF